MMPGVYFEVIWRAKCEGGGSKISHELVVTGERWVPGSL